MKMKKKIGILALVIIMCMASGCVMKQGGDKQRDLEYTVADVNDLPQALKEQLELKKEEDFSLTYSDNQYLYAVRGYGVQETGGYSISVDACYLTENEICGDYASRTTGGGECGKITQLSLHRIEA